jgi:malonyl-CoA O-methyltransferase
MFETNKIANDFSKAAIKYDDNAILQQKVASNLLTKSKHLINKNAKILDAGCGTGQLAKMLQNHNITQIDIAEQMCKMAKLNGKNTITGNINQLPFPDNYFDVVFSSLVVQWSNDLTKTTDEMKRVLKSDGLMAISSLGKNTLKQLSESFANSEINNAVSDFEQLDNDWTIEVEIEYFNNLTEIMRSLKNIGANNKNTNRNKTVMTKSKLQKIEKFYFDNFAVNNKLPVTWNIGYLVKKHQIFI